MLKRTTNRVCANCKLRKKKCDKARPRCGYCARKNLVCESSRDAKLSELRATLVISSPAIRSSLLLAETMSAVLQDKPSTLHSIVYLQTLRIVRLTCHSIEETCLRYFRGIHSFIPILSATGFHSQRVNLPALPSAPFSVLLLSMVLITYHPRLVTTNGSPVDATTLYLTVKSLYIQVLASFPASLRLVQAGIIIASYEYATRRIQEALASISICARTGYATGIHLPSFDRSLQTAERNYTWCGVVITERTILSEVEIPQPAISHFSEGPVSLSQDSDLSSYSMTRSFPYSDDHDGMGRVIQAIRLLDQVFKASKERDVYVKLAWLDRLDYLLRECLALVMDQAQGRWGLFCIANAVLFRTLFILHQKAIHSAAGVARLNSHIALETAAHMVKDIATTQQNTTLAEMDMIPPIRAFVFRAALQYLDEFGTDCDRWDNVKTRLESSLTMFDARWGEIVCHSS